MKNQEKYPYYMKHWMEFTDRFVNSDKLKCCYCGIPLHQHSVNSLCAININNNNNENDDNDHDENVNNSNHKKFNASRVDEQQRQQVGSKGSSLHYFIPFN